MALALPCLFYSKASPQSITISTYELHIELQQQYIVVLSYGKDSCGRFHRGRRRSLAPYRFTPQKVCQLYFPRDFLHNMYEGRNLSCFMIYWCSLKVFFFLKPLLESQNVKIGLGNVLLWFEHNMLLLHTFERLLCKHLTSHQEAPWVWPKFVPISRNPIVQ